MERELALEFVRVTERQLWLQAGLWAVGTKLLLTKRPLKPCAWPLIRSMSMEGGYRGRGDG